MRNRKRADLQKKEAAADFKSILFLLHLGILQIEFGNPKQLLIWKNIWKIWQKHASFPFMFFKPHLHNDICRFLMVNIIFLFTRLRFLLVRALTFYFQIFFHYSKADEVAKWRELFQIIKTWNNLKFLVGSKIKFRF